MKNKERWQGLTAPSVLRLSCKLCIVVWIERQKQRSLSGASWQSSNDSHVGGYSTDFMIPYLGRCFEIWIMTSIPGFVLYTQGKINILSRRGIRSFSPQYQKHTSVVPPQSFQAWLYNIFSTRKLRDSWFNCLPVRISLITENVFDLLERCCF